MKSAFIIPVYCTSEIDCLHFNEMLNSLLLQTDSKWIAIIISDGMSFKYLNQIYRTIKRLNDGRLVLKKLHDNVGPGLTRNFGIQIANEMGVDIVLFQDSDDISHPKRLEVTKKLILNSTEDIVVYSHFIPIDKYSSTLPRSSIRNDMREVLYELDNRPVYGKNAWLKMTTMTGFIATTSTVGLPIKTVMKTPFPNARVSEDYYTWLLISSKGAQFHYTSQIPTKYRFKKTISGKKNEAERSEQFLMEKIYMDSIGFCDAYRASDRLRSVNTDTIKSDIYLFLCRLQTTLKRQNARRLTHLINCKVYREQILYSILHGSNLPKLLYEKNYEEFYKLEE